LFGWYGLCGWHGILDFRCADGCHADVPVITVFLLGRGSSGNSRKWELLGMAEVDGFGEDFGITVSKLLNLTKLIGWEFSHIFWVFFKYFLSSSRSLGK